MLFAAISISGCDERSDATSSVSASSIVAPLKVNVSVVKRVESTTETVVVYGRLVPVRESRLGFEQGGKVKEVRKTTGDRVAEGDVIAFLESGELDKQREQLLTSLEQTRQRLRSATRETAASLQQQIRQVEGQGKGIETELKRRVIVAPFAGLVSEVKVQQGEIAAPAATFVVVVLDEPPQVVASLTEKMASRVLAGKTVWAGLGDRAVELKVKSSSEVRGPIPGKTIEFTIQETLPDDSWSYDDVVELRFREAVETPGCWLPLNALQGGIGDTWYVFAVVFNADANGNQDFRAEVRPVDIRLLQNGEAFVESVLTSGESVIVDGTHRIVPGQQVTPVTNSGQSFGLSREGSAK